MLATHLLSQQPGATVVMENETSLTIQQRLAVAGAEVHTAASWRATMHTTMQTTSSQWSVVDRAAVCGLGGLLSLPRRLENAGPAADDSQPERSDALRSGERLPGAIGSGSIR